MSDGDEDRPPCFGFDEKTELGASLHAALLWTGFERKRLPAPPGPDDDWETFMARFERLAEFAAFVVAGLPRVLPSLSALLDLLDRRDDLAALTALESALASDRTTRAQHVLIMRASAQDDRQTASARDLGAFMKARGLGWYVERARTELRRRGIEVDASREELPPTSPPA
ncbi:MAG TPA: hypothetical protein VFF73_28045 [Planctomycetota bacterium]|nr:hypothetical protein [Planctomycetota bacterium]